jgi:hypothetical protein
VGEHVGLEVVVVVEETGREVLPPTSRIDRREVAAPDVLVEEPDDRVDPGDLAESEADATLGAPGVVAGIVGR